MKIHALIIIIICTTVYWLIKIQSIKYVLFNLEKSHYTNPTCMTREKMLRTHKTFEKNNVYVYHNI